MKIEVYNTENGFAMKTQCQFRHKVAPPLAQHFGKFCFRYIYIGKYISRCFDILTACKSPSTFNWDKTLSKSCSLFSVFAPSSLIALLAFIYSKLFGFVWIFVSGINFLLLFILIHSLSKYQRVIQRQSVFINGVGFSWVFFSAWWKVHTMPTSREREREKKSFGLFAKQSDARIKVTVHVWKVLCGETFAIATSRFVCM